MISKLSARYQFCAIRTADTRDGQLTTPGVYTWVVRKLSMICPSFIPARLEVAFSTYTRSVTKLTVDTADQPTVPSQLEDDSEGRIQRTFGSVERVCTGDV